MDRYGHEIMQVLGTFICLKEPTGLFFDGKENPQLVRFRFWALLFAQKSPQGSKFFSFDYDKEICYYLKK